MLSLSRLRSILQNKIEVNSDESMIDPGMFRIEWTNNMCIELINAFRDKPELWNPDNNYYKLAHRKQAAWESIANTFGVDVEDVRRKMNSLLASYRRQRRVAEQKGHTNWFAYDAFASFINDKHKLNKKQESASEAELEDGDDEEEFDENKIVLNDLSIKVENTFEEDDAELQEVNHLDETSEDGITKGIKRKLSPTIKKQLIKKRISHDDSQVTKMYSILKQLEAEKDECAIFGEYVTSKLKKLSDQARAIAQNRISNILFEAEMGKYNYPNNKIQVVHNGTLPSTFVSPSASPSHSNS